MMADILNNMRKTFPELEQRLVFMLKRNSRMSIIEIANELGVSRATAKKVMDSLVNTGRVKKFTVVLDEEEKDLGLVYTDDIKGIPDNLILEQFKLIDNSFIAVMYFEDIMKIKNVDIKKVDVAKSRKLNESSVRADNIHCDYCQSEIKGRTIIVEKGKKVYYACCPNCERSLKSTVASLG